MEARTNARWSLGLVHVQMANGRRFRVLNIDDDITRECLAAIPDTSLRRDELARILRSIHAVQKDVEYEIGAPTTPRWTPSSPPKPRSMPCWRGWWRTAPITSDTAPEELTWGHVGTLDHFLHIRQRADAYNQIGERKSRAGFRDIPAGPMVLNALRRWKLRCPKSELGLVFPVPQDGILQHTRTQDRFRKLWEKVEVTMR